MFTNSVDSIMASLAAGVQKLHALADRKEGEASGHHSKAAEFAAKAGSATQEAERARRVADKVKALLD